MRMHLLLALATIGAVNAVCPKNYTLTRNGECYHVDKLTYYMGASSGPTYVASECKSSSNGQPIKIKNQDDQDYWMGIAKANRENRPGVSQQNGNIVLGIVCTDKKWQWFDGTSITYKPAKYDSDLDRACGLNGLACTWVMDPENDQWLDYCNSNWYFDIYCVFTPDFSANQLDPECTDFSRDEDDDICYQVGKTSANWTEANTVCRSFGANLASIHNVQENNFIRRLATSQGLVNGILLGGVPAGKQNMFGWIDGTPFDYQNFVPGFPIDGFGDCLAMETNNVNGPWLNIECSTEMPFACVRKTTDIEPVCDGGVRAEGSLIYSPGFPGNSSMPCDFLLKVDTGKLVEVEILLLEANTCCDQLLLTEGPLGGAVIADLTGDLNNGKKFRTTSSNIMRASWQPKGAVNVKGMMITYRGVSK